MWDDLPWTARGRKFKYAVEVTAVWVVTLALMAIAGIQ